MVGLFENHEILVMLFWMGGIFISCILFIYCA